MSLPSLFGHERLRGAIANALRAGRLPPAVLITGAPGVGKQRIALWAGAGIVCERGPGEPCGSCHACSLASNLHHPDVHWFFPIPRPRGSGGGGGDAGRQVEEAEELLAEALAARRADPLYGRPDGLHGLFLPLVRLLQRRAAMRPAMARARVLVVGEAERLVPQASSPEAANAMLKLLEEPPPDTYLFLTASEPQRLLPTMRSRLVTLRAGRLPSALVARFLREVPTPPLEQAEAERRAALADGSIGAALALVAADGAAEAARRFLEAARGKRPGAGLERRDAVAGREVVLAMKPFGGRGVFADVLGAAAHLLRGELAAALEGGPPGSEGGGSARAAALIRGIGIIDEARQWAQGNVNPQLIAAVTARRLAEAGA